LPYDNASLELPSRNVGGIDPWIGVRQPGVPFGPYEDEFTDPGSILQVSDETRDRLLRIGREEFGGASADETVRRLIDEHWQARAVAAVHHHRETNPQGWAQYLAQADEMADAEAPVTDEWADAHE
jgi:hypothetical protein